MSFTTLPKQPAKRGARRFRWVLGGVTVLAGTAIIAQVWWTQMWRSEEELERPEIREPLAKHFDDYDLPGPPEPQIIEVQVPVTQKAAVAEKKPRETPPKRAQPVRQERRQQRALPRLAEVSWRIPAVEPEPRGYRDGRVEMFAQGCALRPGVSIIPAVLLTAVNSEIPGQVIATVMSDVYSPDAGYENKVLVPAGTRVVGVVDKGNQKLTFDRRRIDIAWTDMTMPGGRQVHLGRAFDASVDGSAGSGGHVEQRWGSLFVYATLATVFNVMQRAAIPSDSALLQDTQEAVSGTLGDIGETVLERSLDWEPVITIPADTQIRVLVNESLQVC
jgi:type IV secretory pathway VirB10-like protein